MRDLKNVFDEGLLLDSLIDDKYFNIKRMKSIKINEINVAIKDFVTGKVVRPLIKF